MNICLVVKTAFQKYVRGDLITDVEKIDEILKSEWKSFVTKVTHSSAPKGE